MGDRNSFWTSLPGILTGIAALIGAIVTLYTVVYLHVDNTADNKLLTPTPTIVPATPMPTLMVQTVKLGDGIMHGFLVSNGYIVTMNLDTLKSAEISVSWTINNEKKEGYARFVKVGSMAPETMLLKLTDINPPNIILPIRISSSLKQGDEVERYLGPNDIAPGTVLEVGASRKIEYSDVRNALVTTPISSPGDTGAPVIDREGRVVAMIYGGSNTATISIAIEDIKLSFPEAFSS